MTITYWPFDAGAGSDAREDLHSRMARYWIGDGAVRGELNSLEVIGDSTGMQIKVKSGVGTVKGHWLRSDTQDAYAIAASHATLARVDRVVLYVDWTANEMGIKVVTGTADAFPTAPALVTADLAEWQVSLATVLVPAAASTITAGNVSWQPQYAIPTLTGIPRFRIRRATDKAIVTGTNTMIDWSTVIKNVGFTWSASDPTKVYAQVPGWYAIWGNVRWQGVSTGRRISSLMVNGVSILENMLPLTGANEELAQPLYSEYELAVGDFIQIQVSHNRGSDLNLLATGVYAPVLGASLKAA